MSDRFNKLAGPQSRRIFLINAGRGLGVLTLGMPFAAACASEPARSTSPTTASFPTFRFLTTDTAFVYSRPCFSPSGGRVVFMRAPATANPLQVSLSNRSPWSLWTVPTNGGQSTRLFEHAGIRATRPDWCRETGAIAFTGIADDGGAELYLIDEQGNNLRQVALGDPPLRSLHYPSWYPGGEFLAVTDYRKHQIHRVDISRAAFEPLTDTAQVWAGMCSVSPSVKDGNPLAFAGQRPDGKYDSNRNGIWIKYPNDEPYLLDDERGRMPHWSPGGARIVFASRRGRPTPSFSLHRRDLPGGKYALHVNKARSRGGAITPPTGVSPFDHTCLHAKWSPDGLKLACTASALDGSERGVAVIEFGPEDL